MKPIPFNQPSITELECRLVHEALLSRRLCGDGPFTKEAEAFFQTRYRFPRALLTTSCTDALELASLVARIQCGDEIIVPSFTFVSTASAFALRGAKMVFADSEADNPNVSATEIARLITPRTRAIVVVHYAGVCCDMDSILAAAADAGVTVIEDAAQALESRYKGKPAGSFGAMATFSFHETKNITSGEGGLLVVNDVDSVPRAEIIREKGTNRSAFIRGEVDRYGCIELGSSFIPSEINAALLCGQLRRLDEIQATRRKLFSAYEDALTGPLSKMGISTPQIPAECDGNFHAYYVVLNSQTQRTQLIAAMKEDGVQLASHYSSLHASTYFRTHHDERALPNSDRYSECLVRLPLHADLSTQEVAYVCERLLFHLERLAGLSRPRQAESRI